MVVENLCLRLESKVCAVVFSIVFVLRNAFSPSIMGKEKGENGEPNGLWFFSVL